MPARCLSMILIQCVSIIDQLVNMCTYYGILQREMQDVAVYYQE